MDVDDTKPPEAPAPRHRVEWLLAIPAVVLFIISAASISNY